MLSNFYKKYKTTDMTGFDPDVDNPQSFQTERNESFSDIPSDMGQATVPVDNAVAQSAPTPAEQSQPDFQSWLNKRLQDRVKGASQGLQDTQVTPEDLQNQKLASSTNSLLGALSQSGAQIGNFRGQAAQTNVPDFAKTLNQQSADELTARQGLRKQLLGEEAGALQELGQQQAQGIAAENQGFKRDMQPLEKQHLQGNILSQQNRNEFDVKNNPIVLQQNQMKLGEEKLKFNDAQRLRDKNSAESMFATNVVKSIPGYENIQPGQFSASQMSPFMNEILSAYHTKTSAENQKVAREEGAKAKQEAQDVTLGKDIIKTLDPATNRRLETYQKTIDNANKMDAMILGKSGKLENLTETQLQELAIGINRMLGGSEAASQIEHLVPKNIQRSSAALTSWLTSKPQGTNQQEFVKLMKHTLDREREVSQNSLKQAQQRILKSHGDYFQRNPTQMENVQATYGISPEDLKNYTPQGNILGESETEPGVKKVMHGSELP